MTEFEAQAVERYRYEIGRYVTESMERYNAWKLPGKRIRMLEEHFTYLAERFFITHFYGLRWKKRTEQYAREADKAWKKVHTYQAEAFRLRWGENYDQEKCKPEDYQSHLVLWMDMNDN